MQGLLAKDDIYLYPATAGDRPVGFLLAYSFPRIEHDQDMVYLYEIEVTPEFRQRGIGSPMIQHLKQDCRKRNILKIWVRTEADNVATRALYETTGARCESETYAEYTYSVP